MVYRGVDPRKKKMVEIYLGGLKRTFKSMIRKALAADGVPTRQIVDIQFVGKNVTMLLVPVEQLDVILDPIRKIPHFKVLETFDPLDTTYMKSLPQHQGKTDAELLVIARTQAQKRIQRYIDKLPEARKGTRNYYNIKLRALDEGEEKTPDQRGTAAVPSAEGQEPTIAPKPKARMLSAFIPAIFHGKTENGNTSEQAEATNAESKSN